MAVIIAIAVVAILLGGFLLLTVYEKRTGKRVLRTYRESLDTKLDTIFSLKEKVSLRLVLAHYAQTMMRRFVHDVVKVLLAIIKVLERALLRIGSYMHARAVSAPSLQARTHVLEALRHLREGLSAKDEEVRKLEK